YIITNDTTKEVQFTGILKKPATSVSIPATIKINGQEYKVGSIKANAIKGNKKVKKLTIGENVKTIGKNAFYGCKNLKTVTIKTANLTNASVKAGAFKGLNTKAVVTVPEQKLAGYKKILKAKGLDGKKQKVVGKKMEVKADTQPEPTFNPDKEIPQPEVRFGIGRPVVWKDDFAGKDNVGEYAVNDTIPITAGFEMPNLMYGQWGTKTVNGGFWIRCDDCLKMFDNEDDYDKIGGYKVEGCKGNCGYVFGQDYGQPFTAWYWIPDNRACSVTFHIVLSEGLSYKKGSLKMYHMVKKEVDSSAYHVETNGQNVTVTIDNIKKAEFHPGNLTDTISMTMDAVVSENAATTNMVSMKLSYDNGTGPCYIIPDDITIYNSGKGYDLCFYLKDSAKNKIENAEFILYPKNPGNEIAAEGKHAVSGTGSIKTPGYYQIHGVPAGEYALVMAGSPAGYKNMPALSLIITEDGRITSPSGDKLVSQGGSAWTKMAGKDGFTSTIILETE
ncbi:MAG: leucine-rich repeat protein, partial [Lachnospiraceae bacterium]